MRELSLNRTTSNSSVRINKNYAPSTTSDDLSMPDAHRRDISQAASLEMDDDAEDEEEEEEEEEEVEVSKISKARSDEKISM